jgi:hypothetical protein
MIISLVSTPIDDVKGGGFSGVAFSIEIFANDL